MISINEWRHHGQLLPKRGTPTLSDGGEASLQGAGGGGRDLHPANPTFPRNQIGGLETWSLFTCWWQLKYFSFSPRKLGKMNPFWWAYFSNWGWNQQLDYNLDNFFKLLDTKLNCCEFPLLIEISGRNFLSWKIKESHPWLPGRSSGVPVGRIRASQETEIFCLLARWMKFVLLQPDSLLLKNCEVYGT